MPIDDKRNQLITPVLPTGVATYNFQDQLHDLEATAIIELFEVNDI